MDNSSFNPNSSKFYSKKNNPSIEDLAKGILEGDKVFLSKAITLIESQNHDQFLIGQDLLSKFKTRENTFRIGVSGAPGVGKSTLIEALGLEILKDKKNKLAVLTIDPTSSLSGGSILGDKTRMEKLAAHPNVFIRPSSAGNNLGGVAERTFETMFLCEAAGFNYIIVETVGVGQSEVEISHMVDFFALVLIAGAGDDLQGVKRGIMELPHLLVVNKEDEVDSSVLERSLSELKSVTEFLPNNPHSWKKQVLSVSALKGQKMDEIVNLITRFYNEEKEFVIQNRLDQRLFRYQEVIKTELFKLIQSNSNQSELYNKLLDKVTKGDLLPIKAAMEFLSKRS